MSNILTRNPIYVDTNLTSYKASIAAVLGSLTTLIVTRLRWVAPGGAGQTLEIIDPQSGSQLVMLTSSAAGVDVVEEFAASPRIWADFGVQIPSGKLFIYTK